MRHNYKRIFSYDPIKKEVTNYRSLGEECIFNSHWYDEIFYEVWALSNHTNEVVLGVSLSGDMYQLSPAGYGKYVKEDAYSAQTIHKGAVLTAIANYKKAHDLPFDED